MYHRAEEILSSATADDPIPLRTQEVPDWDFQVLYDCGDKGDCENVFAPENLKRIKMSLEMLKNDIKFQEICEATNVLDTACHPDSIQDLI